VLNDVVNAGAFFVLARPVTRLARVGRQRRCGCIDEPFVARPSLGSWFSRLWRPWVSLHPFRGRVVPSTSPTRWASATWWRHPTRSGPARTRWRLIGGFFFLLFLALLGRLFMLQVLEQKTSALTVQYNSIRQTTIPASG
jgi:hypothetical protein